MPVASLLVSPFSASLLTGAVPSGWTADDIVGAFGKPEGQVGEDTKDAFAFFAQHFLPLSSPAWRDTWNSGRAGWTTEDTVRAQVSVAEWSIVLMYYDRYTAEMFKPKEERKRGRRKGIDRNDEQDRYNEFYDALAVAYTEYEAKELEFWDKGYKDNVPPFVEPKERKTGKKDKPEKPRKRLRYDKTLLANATNVDTIPKKTRKKK